MNKGIIIEVCANSLESALIVQEEGTNRIELSEMIADIQYAKELVEIADDRIVIMAGSSINAENIHQIIAETGVNNCHVSASTRLNSNMKFQKEGIEMGGIKNYPEFEKRSTDSIKLRTIIKAAKE